MRFPPAVATAGSGGGRGTGGRNKRLDRDVIGQGELVDLHFLEVLGNGYARENPTANDAKGAAAGGFEGSAAHLCLRACGEFAFFIERSIERGAHFGGGRDERFPLHIRDGSRGEAIGINAADGEFLRFAREQRELLRHDLQGHGRAGGFFGQSEPLAFAADILSDFKAIHVFAGGQIQLAVHDGGGAERESLQFYAVQDFAFVLEALMT